MTAFQLLHPTVQRKLHEMRWTELRPIQAKAIQQILGETPLDCIIASPTASGKTEAAFLPVLSALAEDWSGGVRAMYIGPLKALINDQFRRLEDLCSRMEMPVHKWHGDVTATDRKRLLGTPAGVLLITPESLEAMFVLRPTQMPSIFSRLGYVVIDELHSFIGSVRGAQLLSQLHRLRARTNADPLRIGLSATLGDPAAAKRWLRSDGRPIRLIEASSDGAEIAMRVRGFWRTAPPAKVETNNDEDSADEEEDTALPELARSLLVSCRGKTNLVFANSKSLIEALADALITTAKALSVPDDIVVHHGSLSKDSREHAEGRLREDKPCTAVCSNTLEMGIDIGEIDSVVQVSAPWSVSSLVQRLGRSGRRAGSKRILRGFFVEDVPDERSTFWDGLHLDFLRAIAIVELLLERFLEPTIAERTNLSTLVQQIMSCAAETGGILAAVLFERTVGSGAFSGVGKQDFAALLRELGARNLIEQLPDATLVLGTRGQRIVEHYSFYAAFKSPTEFQVIHGGRQIGNLPETYIPPVGEHLLLAARRWRVDEIDSERKQVFVVPAAGRRPPRFQSGLPDVHPRIHRKMRALLLGSEVLPYLDETASEILEKAREAARRTDLGRSVEIVPGGARLLLWAGSRVHRTLSLVFARAKIPFEATELVGIDLLCEPEKWTKALREFVAAPDAGALAAYAESKEHARIFEGEKFDTFVPPTLWCAAYGRERLDIDNSVRKAVRILQEVADLQRVLISPPCAPKEVVAVSSVRDWARSIAALSTDATLGAKTVLVPNEAFAHALRVELLESFPAAVTGSRFVTILGAAMQVLQAAGVAFEPGEEKLRALRFRRWLRTSTSLEAYDLGELNSPGWEQAFGVAVDELETSGLVPEDLSSASPELRDLTAVWRGLTADAGASWTSARIVDQAAALLTAQPQLWPLDGPTFAVGGVATTAVEARFLLACPRLSLGIVAARPLRRHAIERLTGLFGPAAPKALPPAVVTDDPDELSILQQLLFDAPDRLATAERSRSRGPDGTVTLEAYAAVSDEINAAVTWVIEEIIERRTPAGRMAILVPDLEPWTTLIAARLSEVPNPPSVYLQRGRSVVTLTSGARLMATLRALADYLPAEAVIDLLPRLRLREAAEHLSPARVRTLMSQLATTGGSRARPTDALAWKTQVAERAASPGDAYEVLPSIKALTEVATAVISEAPLPAIWEQVRRFVESHLIAPPDMAKVLLDLENNVHALAPLASGVTGRAALEVITELLSKLRVREVRFGHPAIYVGTIAGAAGLSFAAVRILGLSEGAFPRARRERIALPDSVCRDISPLISTAETAVVSDLHAFDTVVRGTQQRLALSHSRRDLDGSEREPSALFIEIAAALARPNAVMGTPAAVVPSLADMERDAFAPARVAAQRELTTAPRTESAWLDRTAKGRPDAPGRWLESPLISPTPVAAWATFVDGRLGAAPFTTAVPGVDTDHPISASGLRSLLSCPHQFFLERVLRLKARPTSPTRFRIAPAAYGTLLHRVAEVFFATHGASFGKREQERSAWSALADQIAQTEFENFLGQYPLASETARSVERSRLRRDTKTLIELDWGDGTPRTFVDVERSFGTDVPMLLATDAGGLLVRGRIDRLDTREGVTLVRDLKSGRAHPRVRDEVGPDPSVDLQLALYAEVAKAQAQEWELPARVEVAYVHVDHLAIDKERSFGKDIDVLETAGRGWLSLSSRLLREHAFVRTADPDTCRTCAFAPVCGPRAAKTSAEQLESATGTLADYRDLHE